MWFIKNYATWNLKGVLIVCFMGNQLQERLDPIKIMSSKVDRDTRVYFNNHPKGMAPNNALKIMELLGVSVPKGALDRFW